LKSILLSLDLLFGLMVFLAVIVYANVEFSNENKPSLYYYDAANSIDFLENEIKSKDLGLINETICSYLGYSEYYLSINYYSQSGSIEKLEIGDFKKRSNFCSKKYYMINSELIDINLCISRDYE